MTAIGSVADVEALVGSPTQIVLDKVQDELDRYSSRFIELCPFLCIGTSGDDGADVSPRGDPPGFVKIVDDRTILIPERPGNRRVDSIRNLLTDPRVGLLLLVPGVEETLRINGRGSCVSDPDLLAGTDVNGKAPKMGILIEIDEVFFHCSKAIKRSGLWDPDTQIERSQFASLGEIILAQTRAKDPAGDGAPQEDVDLAALDRQIEADARRTLY